MGIMDIVLAPYRLALCVLGAREMPFGKMLAWLVTNHRWFLAIFIVMPLSFIVNTLFALRARISFWMGSVTSTSRRDHAARVEKVRKHVLNWIESGRKTKLCTARPGWLAMSLRVGNYKKTMTGIPTNKLGHVVDVDTEKQTVFVEPNVTMGQISATLEPLGWTLPVLPELDDLTVGGLINGVGIETSSHKFGLFQHTCKSFEVLLATGEIVTCSRTENAELFRCIPWGHGTLGFLVGAELEIVPCKRYVRLEYIPIVGSQAGVDACLAAFKGDDEFVESLVYSRDEMVLMTGNFADEVGEDGVFNPIGRWYKPWFFTHVREYLNRRERAVEYVPLREYYHRHTKSLFWEVQDIITFGNQFWFRFLFGWMMPPNHSILKRTQTEELRELYEKHHVVQDMLVPASKLDECLDVQDEKFGVYPLWVCPMRIFPEDAGFIHPTSWGEEMFVDVGIYGVPAVDFLATRNVREVEDYVRSVEGFQMLYADMYQTREEFRDMFDHSLYDRVRKQLGCEGAFPEVYDKTSKAARY